MKENLDPFQISQIQLYNACKIRGCDREIYKALREPERFVEIKLTIKMELMLMLLRNKKKELLR